jgi:hypothetical protein
MEHEFLGFRFSPVGIEQRGRVDELLARHPQPLSDYGFASLFAWAPVYCYGLAIVEPDTLLVSAAFGPDCRRPGLLQPVGDFPEELQDTILRHARDLAEPLRIESVSAGFLERHAAFASHFDAVEVRDSANYVYAALDLAELAGRRYAKKRNLITQASRLYAWTVESLGPQHVAECLEVGDDIAKKRTTESEVTLAGETEALGRALEYFGPLGLSGLLLRVDGQPSAFSIFDRLAPSTAVVYFERALRSRKGLYQVINQETARVIAALGFELINREEDLGDPGLRQGKLSYFPARLEMKYTLTLRR